jgi:hypothetical protein
VSIPKVILMNTDISMHKQKSTRSIMNKYIAFVHQKAVATNMTLFKNRVGGVNNAACKTRLWVDTSFHEYFHSIHN